MAEQATTPAAEKVKANDPAIITKQAPDLEQAKSQLVDLILSDPALKEKVKESSPAAAALVQTIEADQQFIENFNEIFRGGSRYGNAPTDQMLKSLGDSPSATDGRELKLPYRSGPFASPNPGWGLTIKDTAESLWSRIEQHSSSSGSAPGESVPNGALKNKGDSSGPDGGGGD